GEVRDEVDLLVDRGNPRGLCITGALEAAFLPGDDDRSGVDAVDASERLDQGRLAGAVLAHQRMDLSLEEAEVHAIERLHSGECDRYPPHLDDGQFFIHGTGFQSLERGCPGDAALAAPPGPFSKQKLLGDQYWRSASTACAASAESNASLGTMMYDSTDSPASVFSTTSSAVSPNSGLYSCT